MLRQPADRSEVFEGINAWSNCIKLNKHTIHIDNVEGFCCVVLSCLFILLSFQTSTSDGWVESENRIGTQFCEKAADLMKAPHMLRCILRSQTLSQLWWSIFVCVSEKLWFGWPKIIRLLLNDKIRYFVLLRSRSLRFAPRSGIESWPSYRIRAHQLKRVLNEDGGEACGY